jgi:hypothetical protein
MPAEPMFTGGRTGHDRDRGLYDKFKVERVSDPDNKHQNCRYFVLDLTHDRFAAPALTAYANACQEEFPALASDLKNLVSEGSSDAS